jgi:hypothetical protein
MLRFKVDGKDFHIRRARYRMQKHLGRKLDYNELVHHKNKDKRDDRLNNLEIKNRGEHTRIHRKLDRISLLCPTCKKKFKILKSRYTWRIQKLKQKNVYCSKSCARKGTSFNSGKFVYKKEIDSLINKGIKEGLSALRIAEKYSLNRVTVYSHLKKINPSHIKEPTEKISKRYDTQITEGLKKGWNNNKIYKFYNIPESVFYRHKKLLTNHT